MESLLPGEFESSDSAVVPREKGHQPMEQFIPRKGMEVYGSDEEKVGEVEAVEGHYFVVKKGFLFPEDHYIPMDAIANNAGDSIYLGYTKDQVLEQGWTSPPAATDTTGAVGTAGVTGTAGGADAAPLNDEPLDRDLAAADRADHTASEQHEANIPVHEEELVAHRREVDRGSVEVNKRVVEHEESVDVPVTEEQVEVRRRAVDREVQPGDNAFEEGEINIPVHGEEVDVEKRARVVEEIDIDKTAEQHTERASDTVRREEVTIDGEEVDPEIDRDRNR